MIIRELLSCIREAFTSPVPLGKLPVDEILKYWALASDPGRRSLNGDIGVK